MELEPKELSETGDQFRQRIKDAIDFIKQQPETNICIVSHGVFLAEFCRYINKPLHQSMHNAQCIHIGHIDL
jgi:broad specificity phosphatase PhoE